MFLHLTESLAQSVTHIAVKRGQRPAKPLLLMHITQGVAGEEVNTAHYRHHLDLAEGAEATVIEHLSALMMLVIYRGTVHYQCRSERPLAAYQAGV